MKSRSDIWLRALEELGAQCSVSTTRDAQTLASRVRQEGDSFLTVTLPAFAKEFEKALAEESISRERFPGWARSKMVVNYHSVHESTRGTVPGVPKFLQGFLDLVFDSSISVGLSEMHVELTEGAIVPRLRQRTEFTELKPFAYLEMQSRAIQAVRQLTYMFAKEEVLPSDKVKDATIAGYIKTDQELARPLLDDRANILFGGRLDAVRRVVRIMFGDVLSDVDEDIYYERLTPKHGPGATADRLEGNQKWLLPTWHSRLETLFPYGKYAVPGYKHSWRYAETTFLDPRDEPPVKVTLVPKTQRAARLIAIEPTCMQYIQQAIMTSLVNGLEHHYVSNWFVGFSQQEPNQFLAQIGSDDRSLATLDLSEASDRVANWLVEDLFADFPHFLEGIQACRSERAKLPSGDILTLQKFASMGSALCFPIEAMVFCAIVVERVLRSTGRQISRNHILDLRDKVRVYGDDIIVPTDSAECVVDGLETFGFKVNHNKSFWTGGFRESCGKEFWNGFDVSVVKIRTSIPTSHTQATEVVSFVSTRNQFYKAGMVKTAALLDSHIEPLLKGNYPIVSESSSVLGRFDNSVAYDVHGWDESIQSPFVRGYIVRSKSPRNEIDDLPALMKCLITQGGTPTSVDEHLTFSGRPRAVSIKLGKARPY